MGTKNVPTLRDCTQILERSSPGQGLGLAPVLEPVLEPVRKVSKPLGTGSRNPSKRAGTGSGPGSTGTGTGSGPDDVVSSMGPGKGRNFPGLLRNLQRI